jgi:hypothetical protein
MKLLIGIYLFASLSLAAEMTGVRPSPDLTTIDPLPANRSNRSIATDDDDAEMPRH